jgi:hypothetical protein
MNQTSRESVQTSGATTSAPAEGQANRIIRREGVFVVFFFACA